MEKIQKKTLIVLSFLLFLYLVIFIFPNKVGAQNLAMVAIFEVDEYAQFPHLMRMIKQEKTFRGTLWHFIAYQHYYYGFPFYALSALFALPVKWIFGLNAVPQTMLILREFVSVLPMGLAILIFVYLQTQFRSLWKSVFLFIFLASIPAIVLNNMWWHPDSLAVLFVSLVFFFLDRDKLTYKHHFWLSAVAVGLATGTKMYGWFFFLTIPIYLSWGVIKEKLSFQKALWLGLGFVGLMALTIVISNPVLLHPEERSNVIQILNQQSEAMSFGWYVAYQKGVSAWFDTILTFYGRWFFIFLTICASAYGVLQKSTRLLMVLILSWVIPFQGICSFFWQFRKHICFCQLRCLSFPA